MGRGWVAQEWLDWLRYLTTSAELSHLPSMADSQSFPYLMDVGLNVTATMVFIIGVFMVRKLTVQPSATLP